MNQYQERSVRPVRRFGDVAMPEDSRSSADRQVDMVEETLRRSALSGAGYHKRGGGGSFGGRSNYRRYKNKLSRPVYSGAGVDDAFSDDDESVYGGDGYYEREEAEEVAPMMTGDSYYDDGMVAGEEFPENVVEEWEEDAGAPSEIPMKWKKIHIPISEEVTLSDGARANYFEIPLRFNKTAKAIAASGAKLGDVHVEGLHHNGPVSFGVRADSVPGPSGKSDIALKAAKYNPVAVNAPLHAILKKSRNGADERKSFGIHSAAPVYDTWLSKFPEHNVKNLSTGVTEVDGTPDVALSVDHPIAQYLHAAGSIDLSEAEPEGTTLVAADLASQARAEIEEEDATNHAFSDAERLRLVLVRAFGAPTPSGAPAMTDPKEVVDGYIKKKRTQADVSARLEAPIAIEGDWVVSYGHPLTPEEMGEIAKTGNLAESAIDDTITVSGLPIDPLME